MNLNFTALPAELMAFVVIAFSLTTIIIHIFFAIGVLQDASRLPARRGPIFVGQGVWCAATLLGGVFVAAVYWAMHHSRLNEAVSMVSTEP